MANVYSIEIGGRFNAAQLQQALKDAEKKAALTVDVKVNAQKVQKALNDAAKSTPGSNGISVPIKVDTNGIKRDLSEVEGIINKTTSTISTSGFREYSKEIQDSFSTTRTEIKKTTQSGTEYTSKTITNLQKVRDAESKADQALKKSAEELNQQRTTLYETERKLNIEAEQYNTAYEAHIAKRSIATKTEDETLKELMRTTDAAYRQKQRENEILDRRLGTLQQIARIEKEDSLDVIKSKAGFTPNATITAAGAFTPVAGAGTWQRYMVSEKEGIYWHNYALHVNEATQETRKLDQGLTMTNKALAAQGETLDRLVVKVAKWAALTTLVYMPIRAFKEALQTLKEVDSELVTIQKVTDLSETQIKNLTSAVYGLASAYGRTADELLAMTSTFARAGFQEQLEEMTELAALTQNVGDLTGEEASKFIIAANAAWKLNGNMSSLMSIIDGMNEVTNHSANDFQALSQGISVAGSVFANAGESAQTFTAMLGTVVASTQRSGSEVARGLRTIAMNIRQIKGELDDGEIIDESSISDAAAALSSIGVSVSENGQLRKVSDVLTDLATKWDDLTTAEQSYVASSLAGKRQANVLIALMQNYDEYYKEMENYANGAGSALRENEIYLDSWEAKTKMLKATWTEFVSGLIDTRLVKGGLDVAIKAVDLLNNNLVQTGILAVAAAKILDPLIAKFLASGFAQSIGLTGLVGGSTLPILGVIAGITALVALADKLIVTTKEQKDKVAQLNLEYEKLYGTGSELDTLISKEGELTSIEERRLKILKAEAELKEEEIKQEQRKYDNRIKRDMASIVGVDYFNERGELETTEESNIKHRTTAMRTSYVQLLSDYYAGGAVGDLTQGLAEMVKQGEEWADVLERSEEPLNSEEQAFLTLYNTIIALYGSYTKVKEANADTIVVVDELTKKLESLDEEYIEFSNSVGIVDTAQQELNNQGFISVETFDKLAKAYPDILKSSFALADGYGVEEDALAALISGRETDAKVMLYNAQTAAIQYINSMSNVALATNASTEAILNQIEALKLQRDLEMEVGGFGGRNNYEEYQRGDAVISQLNKLRDAIQLSDRLARLIGSASTKTTSTSSQNTVLNGINDYYDIIKHRIWLSEQRMGDDVSTEKYKRELEQQAEYYVGLKKWAHEEAEKLRKQGYADESDEIKKLQQIWWESENWLRDQAKKTAEERKKAIDDVLSKLKDNLDLQKDGLDAQIKKLEALIDLHDAYYDTLTEVEKEQANINKELKTAKESYQYLDETTRKMLFNESDYAVLSAKLTDIANDAAAIYDNYQASINALTEDNIYLAEQLTHEFEQQYEAKRKEYEIAKAELAMTKAQTSLQNAKANRNTFMLVNGQFQWVADPKAIKDALEEYADAEQEYNEAIKDASRERIKDELENSKQNIATEKARLEAQYEAIERAWKIITDSMQASTQDISTILRQISQSAAPSLKSAISQFAHWLSALVDIDLTGFDSAMNEGVVLVDNDSGSIDVPIDNSSSSTSDPASERYYVVRNGKMVIVDGYGNVIDNGSTSTSNSSTSSGSSREEEIRALARKYDVDLGVATSMWEANQRGANYDRGGIALGKGILLKDTALAEGVLDPDIMRSVLNPTKNKMFENFVAGVSMLLDEKNLKRLNNGVISGDDHSITVNGMTVTGQAAENLAKAMRAVMPLHA